MKGTLYRAPKPHRCRPPHRFPWRRLHIGSVWLCPACERRWQVLINDRTYETEWRAR